MLLEFPHVQVGARGVAVDFLFYALQADGSRVAAALTGAVEAQCFALFRKPKLLPTGQRELVKVPLTIVDSDGGRARYVTADGFLDVAGKWLAQGFVVFSSSMVPSEVVPLLVKPNLRPFTPVPILVPDPVAVPLAVPAVERA